MNYEITTDLSGKAYEGWKKLMDESGLAADSEDVRTLLIYDGDELIATGSRDGSVLKYIAVADSHRGEDLTASVLTELRRDAFEDGHTHLFLYTKPMNRYMFEELFFYPVAATENVLIRENEKDGIAKFVRSLPKTECRGVIGAAVMNCNPFTLGHRALIKRAASECDHVYVFVLSEDKSEFSFADRIEMVRLGTADIPNVTVLHTGPYLISALTFPTYFIKDRDKAKHAACEADVKIFAEYFAKELSITRRYVGSEPNSALTEAYNRTLKEKLPSYGIQVAEIERVCEGGAPISASTVRKLIGEGDVSSLSRLVPKTTLDHILKNVLN